MPPVCVYQPAAIYQRGSLLQGAHLVVSAEGVVLEAPPADATVISLPHQLLMPGLVNGHSHAFQRVLRGRTEFIAPGREGDDFWSWREAMYQAAEVLTPETLYSVSKQCFIEMALAGITSVGEFHYLQHQPDGRPYEDESLLAKVVVQAARDVGLRICLLRVAYARSGFSLPPNPRQRRFIDADVERYLRRVEALRASVQNDPLVSVGLAPHSVRAVPKSWLEVLRAQGGPLHMHVAEQPAELKACQSEYQTTPVQLLSQLGLLGPNFTAVHAVHLTPDEVQALGTARATVCACPSTERNLGDGIVPADLLATAGASMSLGSDSHAHIDLFDEARQLEGHLRLLRLRRNVLAPVGSDPSALGRKLIDAATVGGARSLALNVGTLAAGESADFITLDLRHPSLLGASPETLMATVGLFASSAAVTGVWVAGHNIVAGRQHAHAESTANGFTDALRHLGPWPRPVNAALRSLT
jgi:formimidoylglutamate deiminase